MELKHYSSDSVLETVRTMDFDNMIIIYDLQSEKYVSVKKNTNEKSTNKHNIKVNLDDTRISYYSNKKTAVEVLDKMIKKKFPSINYSSDLRKLCESSIPSGYLVYDSSTEERMYEDSDGMVYYNTCKLPEHFYEETKQEKELELVYNQMMDNFPNFALLLNNLFNDNKEDIKYFLNWLSSAFLGRKNLTAVVIKGMEGSGKGLLMKFIEWYFSKSNVLTASNEILRTDFNEQMENRMFVNLNEITLNKNRELYEKLKQWITEDTYTLNVKGVRQRDKANNMNYLITSNNDTPLEVSTTDRRYNIFKTKDINIKTIVHDSFFEDIKGEYLEFTRLLKSLKVDYKMADTSIENDVKKTIAHNSTPKKELLVKLMKERELDTIEENIVFENSLDEKNWTIFKNDLINKNLLRNDIGIWLYRKFVPGEATVSSIGTNYSVYFGQSKQKVVNGKKFRYREVSQDKKPEKKVEIINDNECPF